MNWTAKTTAKLVEELNDQMKKVTEKRKVKEN